MGALRAYFQESVVAEIPKKREKAGSLSAEAVLPKAASSHHNVVAEECMM